MKISQYITDVHTTLVGFRILLSHEEVYKSQYDETMSLMPSLLENIDAAMMGISAFLNSTLQSDIKEARDFIEYIRSNRLLANYDPYLQLLEFYMAWQKFYEVLPDEQLEPNPIAPRSKGIMIDGEKYFGLVKYIDSGEINRLWDALKDKYISGNKEDFTALCRGANPTGVLTNTTNRGSEKKSNSALVDMLFYLGYVNIEIQTYLDNPSNDIRDILKRALMTYFAYDKDKAKESLNKGKYKAISEKHHTSKARRELRLIFKIEK